jgi:hypothetical protein
MIINEAVRHVSLFIFLEYYLSLDCDEDMKNKLHVCRSAIKSKQQKVKKIELCKTTTRVLNFLMQNQNKGKNYINLEASRFKLLGAMRVCMKEVEIDMNYVRSEVFTAVTMKNAVF